MLLKLLEMFFSLSHLILNSDWLLPLVFFLIGFDLFHGFVRQYLIK